MSYTAFAGDQRVASGELATMLSALKPWADAHQAESFLVFDDESGKQVDFDLRGDLSEVLARVQPSRLGPGRPKLGVVPREITLLPRHWEWLEKRPNGASATIRRLIDEARKQSADADAKDRAARVLSALAGNMPGHEEALRALYRGELAAFEDHLRGLPADVRQYALSLAFPVPGAEPLAV